VIVEDAVGAGGALSYADLIKRSAVLSQAFKRQLGASEYVGIMLPTSGAAVVSFFALHALLRVPVMINFSSGATAIMAGCRAAKVGEIITSRLFVEKANLKELVAQLESQVKFIYLEDIRAGLTAGDKFSGVRLAKNIMRGKVPQAGADKPAVVLFTSGSEGTPKGVVLSHQNIIANCY
jgi:acyl-[acyl-carrier-protein]-phospholipid O-acyltransferase/long-chain-fatty-acid--[acyl-carrier-protein] ligase